MRWIDIKPEKEDLLKLECWKKVALKQKVERMKIGFLKVQNRDGKSNRMKHAQGLPRGGMKRAFN